MKLSIHCTWWSEESSDNKSDTECEQPKNDSALEYSKEVFSLGILLMEFTDSIKKGDGQRILRYWKYMLLFFKASHKVNTLLKHSTYSGAVLEGFLRFPETTRDCPLTMGMPLFSYMYKVSRGIYSVLNSGITGFWFKLKLRKSSDDLFLLVATKENWRPSQKFVLQRHWKLCMKIPPYSHCKSLWQQAVGNYSAKISRTAPGFKGRVVWVDIWS